MLTVRDDVHIHRRALLARAGARRIDRRMDRTIDRTDVYEREFGVPNEHTPLSACGTGLDKAVRLHDCDGAHSPSNDKDPRFIIAIGG